VNRKPRKNDWTKEEDALVLLDLPSLEISKRIERETGRRRTAGAVNRRRAVLRKREATES